MSEPRRYFREPRRYFPDWTRRPLPRGREVEADHNSYLAGGYAEEFGYSASAEWSRGVPVLDEPPDRSRQRRGLAYMTRPGYPLRPHPILEKPAARLERPAARMRLQRTAPTHPRNRGNGGSYFIVRPGAENGRSGSTLERSAKRAAVRLASSIISLRWSLRRHMNLYTRR